jgi:hypothetical protein
MKKGDNGLEVQRSTVEGGKEWIRDKKPICKETGGRRDRFGGGGEGERERERERERESASERERRHKRKKFFAVINEGSYTGSYIILTITIPLSHFRTPSLAP